MSDNYRISGAELTFMTGEAITFDHPILEALEFPTNIVVLLDVPPKVKYPLNVFGISKQARIIWQIQKLARVGESPYVGLIRRGDRVRLANWDGMLIDVDPATGSVLAEEWAK